MLEVSLYKTKMSYKFLHQSYNIYIYNWFSLEVSLFLKCFYKERCQLITLSEI